MQLQEPRDRSPTARSAGRGWTSRPTRSPGRSSRPPARRPPRTPSYYAKQSLTFAAVLFLLAVTLCVLSFGAPEDSYYIPALSKGAEHVKVESKIEPQLPKLSVPIEIRKR